MFVYSFKRCNISLAMLKIKRAVAGYLDHKSMKLNNNPTRMMPLPTTARKTPIKAGFRTLRNITISGRERAITDIMKAKTVPRAAPLPSKA